MGLGEKIRNKAQEAVGKMRKNAGDATDNESLHFKGAKEEAEAKAKQAGEHLKDAAKHITKDNTDK
ncbi:CsbD family protein [Paeniglutamicibacter sp. MACA_103]|uniref:CsbD family protein n=1 Tax=Paeniglutamicibacter sp. MACA_103 TaxID=3377337 RepID=UPI0038948E31